MGSRLDQLVWITAVGLWISIFFFVLRPLLAMADPDESRISIVIFSFFVATLSQIGLFLSPWHGQRAGRSTTELRWESQWLRRSFLGTINHRLDLQDWAAIEPEGCLFCRAVCLLCLFDPTPQPMHSEVWYRTP
jgi:hypothetical protein